MLNPPLSLYIHIPWCVQKCPYCDFNSHAQQGAIPQQEYIAHILNDLAIDSGRVKGREISTIFIGGGTPSLLEPEVVGDLLAGVKQRVALAENAEITMEANPGTIEASRFDGFVTAGVNRFSVGVQSFQAEHLKILGRIHDARQAQLALEQARLSRVNSFNIDLMHGLPKQSVENALSDLKEAISEQSQHLSWYQLTIEPNTPFYSRPPTLPDDDILWEIQTAGHKLLSDAGFEQYEISGYSKPGFQCQHNLNYWRFGDYLGIGCGAHGKITNITDGTITRTVKAKSPRSYMMLNRPYLDNETIVEKEDLPFEFFMNRFRLVEPCPKIDFEAFTGQPVSKALNNELKRLVDLGLLSESQTAWQVTPYGRRYLNSLLEAFV